MIDRVLLVCLLIVGITTVAYASPEAAKLTVGSDDWKTFEIKRLSFRAPKSLIKVRSMGIDSEVHRFEANDFYIVIDIGEHAQFSSGVMEFPHFREDFLRIGGIAARMIFYRTTAESCGDICGDFSEVYGVFVSPPEINTNISFLIYARNSLDPEVPMRILQSARFRN